MHILVTTNSDSTTQSWMRMDKKHIAQIKKIVPSAKITVVDESAHTLPKLLQTADIIIPANVNALDLRNAQKLKWIHVLSAGIDTLPQYLLDADLLITNSSGVHAIPIAEHVFTFFLMFARQIHKMHRAQIEKKEWTRDYTLPVSELHGKTILIVGLGRIGTKIGELAKVFHMQVIGVARSKHKDASVDTLITLNKLLSYIPKADFVVNALPLTKETEHIFDKTIFSKMAKSAYFINIGRGKSVNEKDLIQALQQKQIAGAGLDVFAEEPLPKTNPLWQLDNVIITPHTAGWNPSYLDRAIAIFCENLKAFLHNQKPPTQVDKKRGY